MSDLPLVLVPGLGLGPEAWLPTLRAWATAGPAAPARVVTLPGYGVRARRTDDLRPTALAARLLQELAPSGPRVVLVGHSAGGQVVAAAAAAAPHRVAGLVLVGPTTDPRAATWPGLMGRWLATAVHEDPRQLPVLLRQYARTRPGPMLRAMDAARRDDLTRHLADAARPVLVVRGRHDRICPPSWADRLVAGFDDRTTRTLAAGAHMVPLTHGRLVAEQVAALVEAWSR